MGVFVWSACDVRGCVGGFVCTVCGACFALRPLIGGGMRLFRRRRVVCRVVRFSAVYSDRSVNVLLRFSDTSSHECRRLCARLQHVVIYFFPSRRLAKGPDAQGQARALLNLINGNVLHQLPSTRCAMTAIPITLLYHGGW